MSNIIISPDMLLPVPVVGVDPGPDWANNVNACLGIIDGHTHTTGQGVPITPAAININTDLTFNGNNATNVKTLRFSPQAAPISGGANLGALYEQGVDLFYIDGAGNQVRITQGGSVTGASGTITGLPSGTASASYAAGTFTFQQATNTPATMSVGSIIIGQEVASGKNVTISAAVAQAANYALALPAALPGVASALVSDNAGNLSFQTFLTLASGQFTPTATPVSNVAGIGTVNPMNYQRVGNFVNCFGSLDVNGTSGLNVIFRISLPITPTFSSATDLSGVGTGAGIPNGETLQCYADVADNLAEITYRSTINSPVTLNYAFSYKII